MVAGPQLTVKLIAGASVAGVVGTYGGYRTGHTVGQDHSDLVVPIGLLAATSVTLGAFWRSSMREVPRMAPFAAFATGVGVGTSMGLGVAFQTRDAAEQVQSQRTSRR